MILGEDHLNRALFARQLLLGRASVAVPAALERIGGIQAQYAPAMYIGLWSRLQRFERGDLDAALEKRTVVQGTLLRSTIHLVSASDYWPFVVAVRDARRRQWLTLQRGRVDDAHMADAARRLRDHLRDAGTLHRTGIEGIIGKKDAFGVGLWLDLVRIPPSGTWARRRADLFATAEDWLGPQPADLDAASATAHIATRYLRAFGPASIGDIATWAGLRRGDITAALAGVGLRRFEAEDGTELIDVARAPLPDPDTAAPVRLLPVWDATILAHARRAGIVAEDHRAVIFTSKNPHSVNTFVVDGRVAGTWWYEGGGIRTEPFRPLNRRVGREVADEAERLVSLYA